MKKILSIVTVVTIISLMLATFVYANDNTDVPQWFKDMITWRKAQVDQAVKDGAITSDQAEQYKSYIDQMEKFHTQGGFGFGGGYGACGGSFYGNGNGANNTGYNYGGGMMGSSYGYNMMRNFNYPVQ
ncbi:MAG: DUF2680 domain-containing protein [Caulobacteraceae bacterium]